MFVKQNYLFKKIVSFGAKSVIFENCVFFFYIKLLIKTIYFLVIIVVQSIANTYISIVLR